eukprot:139473-Amphidinium_carterae.1
MATALCPWCPPTRSASAAPTAGNLWHATAGYPFDLTIEGIAMSLDDRIRVVASAQFCGVDGAQNISTAIADASTTGEAQESVGTANNLTSLTWTGIVLTRVEELRVCWCNGTLSDCSEGVHFDTSLGRIATDGYQIERLFTVFPSMSMPNAPH